MQFIGNSAPRFKVLEPPNPLHQLDSVNVIWILDPQRCREFP
jgi:hypothetical protein